MSLKAFEDPAPPGPSPAPKAPPRAWILSPRADFLAFVAPGWISVAVALFFLYIPQSPRIDLWVWVIAVLGIDVAHVWASLYRSYADPLARKRWGWRLWSLPPAVATSAFIVHHFAGSQIFWRVLAYIAVFHFIQQHIGFLALYQRKVAMSADSRRLARIAIWCNTGGAILWWHTQSERAYHWFTPHDFISIPYPWIGHIALITGALTLLLFLIDQAKQFKLKRFHPMIPALVLTPALTWQLGIVWTNDDRIFTLTNVILHGIPYIVLSYIAGGQATLEHHLKPWFGQPLQHPQTQRPSLSWQKLQLSGAGGLLCFYLPLLALAFHEEFLWDILCWQDHPELFGTWNLQVEGLARSLAVSLLVLPQATHYLLDRYIWRQGPRYPDLSAQLGLS